MDHNFTTVESDKFTKFYIKLWTLQTNLEGF